MLHSAAAPSRPAPSHAPYCQWPALERPHLAFATSPEADKLAGAGAFATSPEADKLAGAGAFATSPEADKLAEVRLFLINKQQRNNSHLKNCLA